MSDDKDPFVKVDISSPISVKAEIKTEIPKENTGRLLDALTDAIRPFTERRGLKADMIRLQREEVLIEIAKRALLRSSVEKTTLHPIPNKFLVPFLEKASLEDGNSPLIDKWAQLLHAAASAYDASMVRFSSVLAELGSRELEFLEKLISVCRSWHVVTQMPDIPVIFTPTHLLVDMRRRLSESDPETAIANFIISNEYPGAHLREVSLGMSSEYIRIESEGISHEDDDSIAVLSSVGVLLQDTIISQIDDVEVWIDAVWLTSFGIKFVTSCSHAIRDQIRNIEGKQEAGEDLNFPERWRTSGGADKIYSSISRESWSDGETDDESDDGSER